MAVTFEDLTGRIRIEGEEQAVAALRRVAGGFRGAGDAAGGMADRLRIDVRGGYESLITTVSSALNVVERLQRVLSAPFETAVRMDSLKRGLEAVTGSSAAAGQQLIRLREVAKLPGLSFADAVEGSIRLQSAGLSAALAERSLKAFGNALATVGKGSAELSGVNLALSQIISKGKVSAEEINQLAERIPSIRKALQAAFGTADTEAIQKMGLTSEQFIERLVVQFERMPQVAGGVQNSLENIAQSIQETFEPLGRAIFPIVEAFGEILPPILDKTRGLFEGIATAIKGLAADGTLKAWAEGLSAVFGNMRLNISLIAGALVGMTTVAVINGILALARVFTAVRAAIQSAGIAAAALAGLTMNAPAIAAGIAAVVGAVTTFKMLNAASDADIAKGVPAMAGGANTPATAVSAAVDKVKGVTAAGGITTAGHKGKDAYDTALDYAIKVVEAAHKTGDKMDARRQASMDKIADNTARTARAMEVSLSLRKQVFGGGRQAAGGVTALENAAPMADPGQRRRPSRIVVEMAGQSDIGRGMKKIAQQTYARQTGYGFNPRT